MMIVPRNQRNGLGLLDDIFQDVFVHLMEMPMMKIAITEEDNEYVLKMNLADYDKEEIQLSLNNGYLTIAANKKERQENTDNDTNTRHFHQHFGTTMHRFYVGESITQDMVKATHDQGTLELRFPKQTQSQESAKYIAID